MDDCGVLAGGERGIGTITWVDPDDADGDGIPGDICEVLWDVTGEKHDYRTGFEGCFRLAAFGSGHPFLAHATFAGASQLRALNSPPAQEKHPQIDASGPPPRLQAG